MCDVGGAQYIYNTLGELYHFDVHQKLNYNTVNQPYLNLKQKANNTGKKDIIDAF